MREEKEERRAEQERWWREEKEVVYVVVELHQIKVQGTSFMDGRQRRAERYLYRMAPASSAVEYFGPHSLTVSYLAASLTSTNV